MIERLERAPSAARLRADLLRNRGRWEEGLAVCAVARAAGDADLDLVVLQFRLEMAAGRQERARAFLDEVLARAPEATPQALFARAVLSNDLDEALALVDRALRLAPDRNYLLTFRARLLRQLGDRSGRVDVLHQAVEAASQAIEADPTSPDTYGERCATMLRLALTIEGEGGRAYAERALTDMRAARDLRPDPELWADAAIALVLLERPLEALAEAAVALEVAPPAWAGADRLHLWRGHARALLGEHDEAAREWGQGRLGALSPTVARVHARWLALAPAETRERVLDGVPAALRAVIDDALFGR
ncbi:MAG: hypothetical protein KF878_15450 [Planctomycetes bacterium]|nr:hypothetical protein [Planctomycetota bacterium]